MSELVAAPTATPMAIPWQHPIHKWAGRYIFKQLPKTARSIGIYTARRLSSVHTPRSSGPRVSGCRGALSSYFLMFLVVPVRYNSYIQHRPRRRASRRVAESPPLTVLLAAANWRRQEWGEFQNEHRRSETFWYRYCTGSAPTFSSREIARACAVAPREESWKVPCQKGAIDPSCRVDSPDINANTMELHWERLGRLFGPLVIIGSLSGLLHLEFEWSIRWAVVAGLFVAVRLQKWALI